jgi:hypothetical protein
VTGDVGARKVALFLGAGFSKAGHLPLTRDLLDGQLWIVSRRQQQRVIEVLGSWDAWRAEHGDDVGEFLHAAFRGQVETSTPGTLPGAPLPWPWVAQYLAARLSEHTGGARGGNSPRYFEGLANPSRVGAHQSLFRGLSETGCTLVGVVTSNYDLLAERVLRPRAVRGWPTGGFHYAGLPQPQVAVGTGRPWRARDGSRSRTIELTGEVPLAKLHGSLNWERHGSAHDVCSTVTIWQDLRRSFRLDATPAIVAPVPEDLPELWLQPIWDAAASLLRSADEWVVIGYSLPVYDQAIRSLLSAAAHGQSIVVRDPRADSLLAAYRELLPDSTVVAGAAL